MTLPAGNIQETLFVPLWGRAYATKKWPSLLNDAESTRIADEVGYDFSHIDSSKEYYCLASAVRAANFDREIKEYLSVHPEAVIISIGSGLDTTFSRIDNGSVRWFDLDLPEIIELRNQYIAPRERSQSIAQSCFDYSWINRIDYTPQKGCLFIVGGVLYYFEEEVVGEFIKKIAESFPDSSMVFDTVGKVGLKISNNYVKKTGNKGAEMYFALRNTRKFFSKVSPKIHVAADYPFYRRIAINKEWTSDTKFRMRFSDLFSMVRLVRLEFKQ